MIRRITYFISILITAFSCQQPSQKDIGESLEHILKSSEPDSLLTRIYEERNFKPIWVKSGGLKKQAENYFNELNLVAYDGLNKEDYIPDNQHQLLKEIGESSDPKAHAALDIAISQSFLNLASDMNIGKINPSSVNISWRMSRKTPTADYGQALLAMGDGKSLEQCLDELRPQHVHYEKLSTLLEELLSQESSEETKPVNAIQGEIERGDHHDAIPLIREKLVRLGDLPENDQASDDEYDDRLYESVRKFQLRHGLIADGVIGSDFIASVNYNNSDLITKIKVNLERLRWLPDFTSGEKARIIVNIPDFQLYYMEGKDTVFKSRVVVGKDYRQTPVFKAEMTYLVFSPTWTLPQTILWEDVIPAIRKDASYLEMNDMKVFDHEEKEVDFEEIPWDKLEGEEDFPYFIRQGPGGINPLGKVKFMFPNEYSIYIHDSPARELFSQDDRTFSSGCIRMENPFEFARILLEGTDWNGEKIREAMDSGDEKRVDLAEAKDVWLLYLSIWDDEGRVEMRKDIYGMDRELAEALSLPVSEQFL